MVFLHRFWAARPVQQFLACFDRPHHARRRPNPGPSAGPSTWSAGRLTPAAPTNSSHSTDPPPSPQATPNGGGAGRLWPWSAFLAVGIHLLRQQWSWPSRGHASSAAPERRPTRGGAWELDLARGLCSLAIVQPGKPGRDEGPTGSVPPDKADPRCSVALAFDPPPREWEPASSDTGSPPCPSTDEGWHSLDEPANPRQSSPDLAQAEQDLWATGHRLLARLQGLKALAHWDQGHWSAGLKLMMQAAHGGDAESQHNLGYVYETGLGGVAIDLRRALDWYEAAASQDYPPSVYNLGVFYERGTVVPQDLNRAQSLFQRAQALEQRSDRPQTNPDCDPGLASHAHHEAPPTTTTNRTGDPRSVYLLARAYQYGLSGLPADAFFALELYREAAKWNYPPAQAAFQALFKEIEANPRGKTGLAHSASLSDIPGIPQLESDQPGLTPPSSQCLTTLNSLTTDEESAIFLS